MDATYRFRFLIYLAAFMLVMSLCFVYAEPLPTHNPLLFQVTPQRSGFLSGADHEPTFDGTALRAAAPAISPQTMEQLEKANRPHRGLFRRARRTGAPQFPAQAPMGPWSASSVFHIVDDGPSSAATAR
jgi:hypothetical protein